MRLIERAHLWVFALMPSLAVCSMQVRADDDQGSPNSKPAQQGTKEPYGSMAQRFAALTDEFDAARTRAEAEAEKGKTEAERRKIHLGLLPDDVAFSRRMNELAASDPTDPAARDALLWVIDKPGRGSGGPYGDEFTRAVLLLLRFHADDPETCRIGLGLDNDYTPARDMLLEGLYIQAKGHEAKGLARLALAGYLKEKLRCVEALRNAKLPLRSKARFRTSDGDGKLVEKEFDLPPELLASQYLHRLYDPEALRSEARRLFEEVIRDYEDVPHVTRRVKELEALLKQPTPTWNGKPLTPEQRTQIEHVLSRKKSLADVARERLDEMDNLVVGKPAPAIDGVGMDGKPLKLSDYRGKAVLLVFWGTWCGPCMAEVPNERALAERFKDRPFAILGVDCDPDKDTALKVMKEQGITWPNWYDGAPGEGPIVQRYHVRSFPTTYLIDAQGLIRDINLHGEALGKTIDGMIKGGQER